MDIFEKIIQQERNEFQKHIGEKNYESFCAFYALKHGDEKQICFCLINFVTYLKSLYNYTPKDAWVINWIFRIGNIKNGIENLRKANIIAAAMSILRICDKEMNYLAAELRGSSLTK